MNRVSLIVALAAASTIALPAAAQDPSRGETINYLDSKLGEVLVNRGSLTVTDDGYATIHYPEISFEYRFPLAEVSFFTTDINGNPYLAIRCLREDRCLVRYFADRAEGQRQEPDQVANTRVVSDEEAERLVRAFEHLRSFHVTQDLF